MTKDRLSVTVVSGFLGAGKTTLLKAILRSSASSRVAVIVNDMAELNIDADLINRSGLLAQNGGIVVEMTNGCICCTLRDDLVQQVREIAAQRRFDHLLIESTGIGEPLPVAASFVARDTLGQSLADVATIDAMVTVVDASTLAEHYVSLDTLLDRHQAASENDDRTLAELIVEQVEFADVLVLNKISSAGDRAVNRARQLIRALNAEALIVEADYGCVPINQLLNTGAFDLARAEKHPTWYKELHQQSDHVPETEEYGIHTFVFRSRRPFQPQELHRFCDEDWPGVIRAKGHFWLATKPDTVLGISKAGPTLSIEPVGTWWCSLPRHCWPTDAKEVAKIEAKSMSGWGDRRNEIVFIGSIRMNEAAIVERLERCLVSSDASFAPERWTSLVDPFPTWEKEEDAVEWSTVENQNLSEEE